jgi:predicted glycosyltransferase
MRILIDIGHPAHVHFFKNLIKNLENEHEVKITARDKEVTLALLRAYGFEYEKRGEIRYGLLEKAYEMFKIDYMLYKIARNFDSDLLLGVHNPYIAHVSRLFGKPSIIFTDTENVKIASLLTYPFANVICTPSCFKEKIDRKKHVKYNGFKELAYLHPNYFIPNSDILDDINLSKNSKFIILRFISWGASHDAGLRGIKKGAEIEFIKSLEQYGEVFITSERKIDKELEKYKLIIPPEKIHSLLYYAQLYIGEGGTMATEAAILGTPAIHIEATASGRATGELCGNFLELRDKYDLLYFFANQNQALEKAIEILENKNSKSEWQRKRERLLKDKIDVTAWMTDFIERYPESFYEYREKSKGG